MKGSFTFLSLLCCLTAKGNSFLIQSKSYKMKYIYQLRRKRKEKKKKERNEKREMGPSHLPMYNCVS